MCRSQSFDVIRKRIERKAINAAMIATVAERTTGGESLYFIGWLDALGEALAIQDRVLAGESEPDEGADDVSTE